MTTPSPHLPKLQQILEAIGPIDLKAADYTPDKIIEEVMPDSLDVVQLILEIEEEWGINIPDSEAEGFTTIQDILTYIEENAD